MSIRTPRLLMSRHGVYRFRTMDQAPGTRLSLGVVTIDTFTPNSYGVRALPLAMHSTSGACSAYSLFLVLTRLAQNTPSHGQRVIERIALRQGHLIQLTHDVAVNSLHS